MRIVLIVDNSFLLVNNTPRGLFPGGLTRSFASPHLGTMPSQVVLRLSVGGVDHLQDISEGGISPSHTLSLYAPGSVDASPLSRLEPETQSTLDRILQDVGFRDIVIQSLGVTSGLAGVTITKFIPGLVPLPVVNYTSSWSV